MAQSVSVKTSGVWRTVKSVGVKTSGVWRTDCVVYVKTSGVWRTVGPVYEQTNIWNSTWSQSYRPASAQRSTSWLYQGKYPGYDINMSVIGFDDANIRSILAGRNTIEMKLTLRSEHWYNGDFTATLGSALIGMHNDASPANSTFVETYDYSSSSGHAETWYGGYSGARKQTKTFVHSNGVQAGARLRDNQAKGFTLEANGSTSTLYYAYFHGHSSTTQKPVLTIKHGT